MWTRLLASAGAIVVGSAMGILVGAAPAMSVLRDQARQVGDVLSEPTPPTTPGTPVVTPNGLGAILNWTASTDDIGVVGYDVVRVQGSTETPLVSTTTNSATLTGLASGTQYVVAVYARDPAGNRSLRSGTATFVTPVVDPLPPGTPTNLTVSAVSATGVMLSWTAPTGGGPFNTYQVLRSQDDTIQVIGSVAAPATTITLTGLTPNTRYLLSVRARASNGMEGAATPVLVVTTPNNTDPTCRVSYVINWTGGTGFGATASITNLSTAPISGWTLGFSLPAGQGFGSGWNGIWTGGTGPALSVASLSWNSSIAPGATLAQSPTFNGTYPGDGAPVKPTAFTVNGAACAVA